MRQSLLISFFFFTCLTVNAAQNPSSNNRAYISQPVSSASAPRSEAIETYLTPYSDAESRFLQFLDQAKTRCYIASYSITAPNIINKLIQLHYRGVDVQIITDRTQAGGHSEQAALAALKANGIPVYIGKSIANALMHCKFAILNDNLTEDGSYNLTISANKEDNILNFVDSKPRAEQFLNYWFKIRNDMQFSRTFAR